MIEVSCRFKDVAITGSTPAWGPEAAHHLAAQFLLSFYATENYSLLNIWNISIAMGEDSLGPWDSLVTLLGEGLARSATRPPLLSC